MIQVQVVTKKPFAGAGSVVDKDKDKNAINFWKSGNKAVEENSTSHYESGILLVRILEELFIPIYQRNCNSSAKSKSFYTYTNAINTHTL